MKHILLVFPWIKIASASLFMTNVFPAANDHVWSLTTQVMVLDGLSWLLMVLPTQINHRTSIVTFALVCLLCCVHCTVNALC